MSGEGKFFVYRTTTFDAVPWGFATDRIATGDYDGDGKADFAVVRDVGGVYYWYALRSTDGSLFELPWGLASDVLTPGGDYDGDGKADVAVWRPSIGTFFVRRSSDGGVLIFPWGVNGDVPLAIGFGTPLVPTG